MLAPVSLAAPDLLLYRVPNDIFLASPVVLGFFTAILALRLVYMFSDNPKMWADPETARAAWSINCMRLTAVACLICSLFLIGRTDFPMTRNTWNPMSLNKRSWNIVRIVVALVIPITSSLINTNPVFRIYCAIAFPGLALMDMLSQIDLASNIYCIDQGTCVVDNLNSLYPWMYRDMAGIYINVCGTTLSWYLWGWLGFCSNQIYLPRYEHRVLTAELNGMKLKKRNVRRRLGDGEFIEW